jgi:hypothetical protein
MRRIQLSSRCILVAACLLQAGAARAEEPETSDAKAATPTTTQAPAAENLDAELGKVLDELVEARSRAAFLGKRLFDTQLSIRVTRSAAAQTLATLRIFLDGAPVHSSDGQVLAQGEARIFEGAVAEGLHQIRIETQERAVADSAFENVRSESFTLKVLRKRRTDVELILKDRSDLAEETAEGDDGEVDVHTRMRVKSREAKRP